MYILQCNDCEFQIHSGNLLTHIGAKIIRMPIHFKDSGHKGFRDVSSSPPEQGTPYADLGREGADLSDITGGHHISQGNVDGPHLWSRGNKERGGGMIG